MNALKPKVSIIFQKKFCNCQNRTWYWLSSLEANAKLAKKKGAAPVAPGEEVSPTIYVENLPSEANESMLNLLFQQFPGFKKRNCAHPEIIIRSIFWNFHRFLEFLKLSISKSSAAIWRKSLYRFCWTSTSCQCEDCPPGVQSDARKSNSAHFRQKLVFLRYS